ncbi:MAG TPA: hypothetical protein DHW14_00850 [Clostridiales bacterium]|nr:hypothetical protein [Clostridiales bacterium]
MWAWTEGRLKTLIFVALIVVAAALVASLVFLRAQSHPPEGADVVVAEEGRTQGSQGYRARARDILRDLRSLWDLEDHLLNRDPEGPEPGKERTSRGRG